MSSNQSDRSQDDMNTRSHSTRRNTSNRSRSQPPPYGITLNPSRELTYAETNPPTSPTKAPTSPVNPPTPSTASVNPFINPQTMNPPFNFAQLAEEANENTIKEIVDAKINEQIKSLQQQINQLSQQQTQMPQNTSLQQASRNINDNKFIQQLIATQQLQLDMSNQAQFRVSFTGDPKRHFLIFLK